VGAESANAVSALAKTADAADVAVDAGRTAKVADAAAGATEDIPPVLFRGDKRLTDDIFDQGFQPRGTSTDLRDYVETNRPSAFVGTSTSPEIGTRFAGPGGFRYMIDPPPGGVDVNAVLGSHHFEYEHEIAFPGGIAREHIIGAHPVNPDWSLGDFVHNPNFAPPQP
jgi:hypothetical protein